MEKLYCFVYKYLTKYLKKEKIDVLEIYGRSEKDARKKVIKYLNDSKMKNFDLLRTYKEYEKRER